LYRELTLDTEAAAEEERMVTMARRRRNTLDGKKRNGFYLYEIDLFLSLRNCFCVLKIFF
jgi:hypothetical protein